MVKKKIAICGSMVFAKEMLEAKTGLEERGFNVHIQEDIEDFTKGKTRNEDKWAKIKFDPFKKYFEVVKKCDGILVVNIDKKGVKGYIGGNSLIEMAFAHVLGKKIYLMNVIPDLPYKDEIEAFKPVLINFNLKKVK
jgi:hypothetical protein